MVTQSRGPTNPYYYGRAEDIDPTYLALIQILQAMMANTQGISGKQGPGGSYNPFAWMDEGGLTPDQKRLADEQKQAVERQQAMNWNLNQPGMRDYLGTQQADGSFSYQPTPQDILGWEEQQAIKAMQAAGLQQPQRAAAAAPSTGGSRGSTGGGGGQSSAMGMLTPEMLTAFMKSFEGGGADTKTLESIDTELQWLRENPGATPEEKQANAARAAQLQGVKDKMLSGSGVSGGSMAQQLQQLLSLFAGPQKKSEISIDIPEGTTGVPSKTRFGVGALPATGEGATATASYLTEPEAAMTMMGLFTPEDDRQKLLDKAKTQSSPRVPTEALPEIPPQVAAIVGSVPEMSDAAIAGIDAPAPMAGLLKTAKKFKQSNQPTFRALGNAVLYFMFRNEYDKTMELGDIMAKLANKVVV